MRSVATNRMPATLFVSSVWASGSRCGRRCMRAPPCDAGQQTESAFSWRGKATVNAAAAGIASPSKTAVLKTPAPSDLRSKQDGGEEIPTGIW